MPPPSPLPPAAKKGIPAIAWLGLGCGGLMVILIVGSVFAFFKVKGFTDKFTAYSEKAGAELVVSKNPDLTMISQNEAKGMMTIRLKDGKDVTLSYKDIAEGKITTTDANGVTTSIGSKDLSQLPAWVPRADDLSEGVSLFHTDGGGLVSGQFAGKSAKDLDDLKTFFATAADGLGLSSNSTSSMNMGGTAVATLEYSGGGKTLKIVITEKSGALTLINTQYSER